jgi:hypothetical protein
MSSKALLDFTWVGEGAIEPPFGISSRGESTLFIPFLGPNFAWTWVDVFANNADADDAAAGDGDGDTVMMRSPPDVRGQPS